MIQPGVALDLLCQAATIFLPGKKAEQAVRENGVDQTAILDGAELGGWDRDIATGHAT